MSKTEEVKKQETLLTPECGHHCGAKESAPQVTYVGHCNCPTCHNGNAPESHYVDKRNK